MIKKLELAGYSALVLGIIAFIFLVYNIYVFTQIESGLSHSVIPVHSEELAKYVFIGFLESILFHLVSLTAILMLMHYHKRITLFRLIILFLGIASFVCIIGDWAALSDIFKQYRAGLSTTMEWIYLYLALVVHVVYLALLSILMLHTRYEFRKGEQPQTVVKDEVVFNLVQYIGLLCGLGGLAFTLILLLMNIPAHMLKYLIPFYCPFIIFPYCFILFYWLVMQRRTKVTDWYDEKQWLDLAHAGLLTLVLSIPAMAVLFLLNYLVKFDSMSMIWFPGYLFMILVLFSGSTLYFNRRGV